MTRNLPRRLERLETRAKEMVAATPELHTIRFIDTNMRVVSMSDMGTSKWMHFDPPRDPAEFGPMV